MVRLNRIYTRTGDDGTTGLVNGERRLKCDKRVACFGSVDETNAAVGVARLHVHAFPDLDVMLIGVQNDLFDLGADLATPEGPEPPEVTPLRVGEAQVVRLEREIDFLNRSLEPLRSFVPALASRSPWSYPRCALSSSSSAVSRTCFVKLVSSPPGPTRLTPCSFACASNCSASSC